MKFIAVNLILISLYSIFITLDDWLKKENKKYTPNYKSTDKTNIKEYQQLIKTGYITVEKFFDKPFAHKFQVYIHPDRNSLDSTWQQDWKMPGFKSECWMEANGVAKR